MKVKIGDKVYDGEEQPVMIIVNDGERKQIANMAPGCTKYCSYPCDSRWTVNDYEKIKEWMEEI
jgi:hypothetical protein